MAALALIPTSALARSINLQGRIANAAGAALSGPYNFRVQILAPTSATTSKNCVLYEESQDATLGSTGLFSLAVADSTATNFVRNPLFSASFDSAITNSGTATINPTYCDDPAAVAYKPSLTDNRQVKISFRPAGSTAAFEDLQVMDLNPTAYAMDAGALSGVHANEVLKFTGAPLDPALTAMAYTDLAELKNLTAGSSTQYVQKNPTNGSVLPITAPSVPVAGSIWYEGGLLKYSDGSATPIVLGGAAAATSISASAPVVVTGSAGSQTVSMAKSTASVDGYLAAADFDSFNKKLSSTLNSALLFVGDATNKAVGVAPSKDISLDNTGAFTVNKIQNVAVSTASGSAGQVLRFTSGTAIAPGNLTMADVHSKTTGGSFLSTACGPDKTLYWDSASDNLSCQNIAISGTQISAGTINPATAFSAGTIPAANLPASASLWQAGTSPAGSINYTAGNVGIGTASPGYALHLTGDGAIVAQGTAGTGVNLTITGAGERMMWIPRKGAFRAGSASSSEWDDGNVGSYSVAMGQGTKASGYSSAAFNNARSTNTASFAAGGGTASGQYSTSLSNANATGDYSLGWGNLTVTGGAYSQAGGSNSVSIGDNSSAVGKGVQSPAFAEFVVGSYNQNTGSENATGWALTDPLFIVGNGTSAGAKSNAMTILKNGAVGIGTISPAAALDVAGQTRSISPAGSSYNNTSSSVDWNQGNTQSMSAACTSTAMANMLDGGTYVLAVTETSAITCTFAQSSLTFLFSPANTNRISGQQSVYTFQRIGSTVYVSWIAGFQ